MDKVFNIDHKGMKVVHLSTTDFGGAYKAVERIQSSLQLYGVESKILVRSRFFDTETTEVINTPLRRFFSKSRNLLNLFLSKGDVVTDLFGTDMRHNKDILDADVIVLHWVNSFISDRSVCQLMELGKPVFWVMHDMWPFTGGCHYDLYCESYKSDCASCPMIKKQRLRNISAFNLKRKRNLFASMNITMIAISRWEQTCAQESFPLKGKKVIWISNPLNTGIFKPMDEQQELREQYKIPEGKKVILFGADKALENATKGFSYLVEALRRMDGSKYVAICFGKAPEKDRIQLPNIDIKYLGTIQDEKKLAAWYSLADVFVAPSIQEAFGYTVCEALACGTPVTAFEVGGMLDQIDHRENGYLARLYDVEDLAEGIEFCAENKKTLGKRARETVLERNSYEVIGKKYKEVFECCGGEET